VSPSADAAVVPIAGAARAAALKFVVLIGVVSLFADMTYEAARSITGPFLGLLGASGAAVGVIAGGGELIGYALRLWSGRLADRTQRYWLITISGYAVNLLAVPLLALAGHWVAAAVLIVLERAGKAVRTPARDVRLGFWATRSARSDRRHPRPADRRRGPVLHRGLSNELCGAARARAVFAFGAVRSAAPVSAPA
jgi:hypothetical protein